MDEELKQAIEEVADAFNEDYRNYDQLFGRVYVAAQNLVKVYKSSLPSKV
jgi:hypothetical protein